MSKTFQRNFTQNFDPLAHHLIESDINITKENLNTLSEKNWHLHMKTSSIDRVLEIIELLVLKTAKVLIVVYMKWFWFF